MCLLIRAAEHGAGNELGIGSSAPMISLTCRNSSFGTHDVGNGTKNVGIDVIFRQRSWLWGERSATELSWGIFLWEESMGKILSWGEWRWWSRTRKFSPCKILTWISAAWLPSNSQYPPGYLGPGSILGLPHWSSDPPRCLCQYSR